MARRSTPSVPVTIHPPARWRDRLIAPTPHCTTPGSATTSRSTISLTPARGARNTGRSSVTPIWPRAEVVACCLRNARINRGWRAAVASTGAEASTLNWSLWAALIPPKSGSTNRSTTSAPRWEPMAALTDRSPATRRRGRTSSRAIRARPRRLMMPERTTGPSRLGTPRMRPPGSGRTIPRDHTAAAPVAGATRSSPNPRSWANSTAPGTRAKNASGPVSMDTPATWARPMRPPALAPGSSTTTRA